MDYWNDDCSRPSDFMVLGPREPTFTGLYDINGVKLFRLPPPVGFHHPLLGDTQ